MEDFETVVIENKPTGRGGKRPGSGRKPKDPNKVIKHPAAEPGKEQSGETKTESKKQDSKKPSDQEIIDRLKGEYTEVKVDLGTSQKSEQEKADAQAKFSKIVNGYMLLVICDFIFPTLIKWMLRKSKPDLKIEQLKLSKKEKEELLPVADAAAEYLIGGMNPVALFTISLGATYLGKVQDID